MPLLDAITTSAFTPDGRRKVLIADLFCGAGGSSTGALRALRRMNIEPVLTCCNHWPVAVASHKANHPQSRHFIEDLAKANPLDLVPEGYLDLLMASPSCQHHSRARGGRPSSDQQRSDPYHILKWVTDLSVTRLMIENVPEFVEWSPINPQTGKPNRGRKGEYFRAWVQRLKDLGFTNIDWRILNAADYGDGTSRHRFFMLARSDGKPIVWPEPTHSADGTPDLFGNGRQKHRGAREFINWKDPGKSIFDRKRPLAGNTIRRIATGLVKFSNDAALPYLQVLKHEGMLPEDFVIPGAKKPEQLQSIAYLNSDGEVVHLHGDPERDTDEARVDEAPEPIVFQVNQGNDRHGTQRPVSKPLYTVVTRDSQGLAVPTQEPFVCANRNNNVAKGMDDPIPVVTTAHGGGLFMAKPEATPVEPSTIGQQRTDAPRSIDRPTATVATAGKTSPTQPELEPFVIGQHGGATPRSVDEPVPTITTDGYLRLFRATAEPFVLNRHGENGTGNRSHSLERPMPTVTCRGAGYLIEPHRLEVAKPYLVNMKGQSDASDIDKPTPTITAHAAHLYVAKPCVINMKKGAAPVDVDGPVPTMTAHSSHLGLAQPCLVMVNHGDDASGNCDRRAKSIQEPVPTITTNPSFGLAQPELFPLHDPPLHHAHPTASVTCGSHLNLADTPEPFVTPFYGSNVGTSAGADDISEPLATITGQGNKHGLCRPFLTPYYGVSVPRSVEEPVGTITTHDRYALCRPFLVPQFGERAGQEPRTHKIDAPLPAVTSHGAGALVQPSADPLIVQVDQTGSNGSCVRSIDSPLPTIVTKQNSAVVAPFIVSTRHVNGGPTPRTVENPLPTITAGGSQVAIVEPVEADPQTQPHSGRLVWINGRAQWLDILFRMLRNPELASAMGFNDEDEYHFCGTQTEVTKQIGNAVPVGTATALVAASCSDLVDSGLRSHARDAA